MISIRIIEVGFIVISVLLILYFVIEIWCELRRKKP